MQKRDCRQLTPSQQEIVRRRAVGMVAEGHHPTAVAQELGVSVASVFNWIKRSREGGDLALNTKPRSGRPKRIAKPRDDSTAKPRDESTAMMIIMTQPNQVGHRNGLWTRAAVTAELFKRYELKINRRTIGRMCRQFGLQSKRPHPRVWKDAEGELGQWAREHLPALRKRAKHLGAGIYVADVSPVDDDTTVDRVWRSGLPSGPRLSGCSMISAASLAGSVRFMVAERDDTTTRFRNFIDRLMHGEDGHLILVVEGDLARHAKEERKHVEKFGGKLRVFPFQSYMPGWSLEEIGH